MLHVWQCFHAVITLISTHNRKQDSGRCLRICLAKAWRQRISLLLLLALVHQCKTEAILHLVSLEHGQHCAMQVLQDDASTYSLMPLRLKSASWPLDRSILRHGCLSTVDTSLSQCAFCLLLGSKVGNPASSRFPTSQRSQD